VEEGLKRRRIGGGEWNRLDAQQIAFHQRVRQGYLKMAAEEPDRWRVVNARQKPDQVQKDLRVVVSQALKH